MNKGCSTSWHLMVKHLSQLAESVIQQLDVTNANPDSLLQIIKDEYEKDSTQYLSTLT